jgi:hypothetical protein
MGKIATTWQLMKDAWGVLMRDKVLLLFPVISGIACFLVLLTFVVPWLGASALGLRGVLRGQSETIVYVVLFCYYLCNFFVVFYFNAALVDFVVTRMRGGEPTLGGSLRAAAACLPQIAAWALIAATVGVLLEWLSERAGFIGRIVIGIVGIAWALVTYFVVPIMVIERKGALDAVASSKDLLRKTWGPQIASGVGYGLIGFLLALPGIAIIIAAFLGAAVSHGHLGGWGVLVVAAVLYFIALGVVMSALRAIFGAVLYLYARDGKAPEGFDAGTLRGAIAPAS